MATVTSMSKKRVIVICAAIIFATSPLIWFRYFPLIDYPRHLASLQIRQTFSSDINVANFYAFHWVFTPDLGLDLLATPLLSVLPVEIVGKIVICLAFATIYGGTILLDRGLNPNNWGPSIFAGIFLYNASFDWGFINYIIGIGFAILAFWMWVRYREKIIGFSIVGFTALGLIVGLMHFYAFAIYGICVAGYECSFFSENLRIERRLRISLFRIPFRAAISIIVPMVAMLIPASSGHGPLVWGRPWGPQTFWDSLVKWKGEALVSPIYFHHFLEKPLLIAVLAILVWALATRTLVVNSRMLIPLAAFGVIFLVMPSWGFVDYRLPSGVAFFAWASLGWGETSRARIGVVSLLLALCLIVRVGSVFSIWQPAQSTIEEYDTALKSVQPGSRLLVIMDDSGWSYPSLVHVPLFPATKQGVFVQRDSVDDIKMADDIKLVDYLMEIRNPPVKIPTGISLKEVGRGQTFNLYRIGQGTEPQSIRRGSGAALRGLHAGPPDPTIVIFPNGRNDDVR
ncbi:MAG TPA: hypothetical protein VGI71_06105 [Scandinavium sp.]